VCGAVMYKIYSTLISLLSTTEMTNLMISYKKFDLVKFLIYKFVYV
jgi:hypothetical protein